MLNMNLFCNSIVEVLSTYYNTVRENHERNKVALCACIINHDEQLNSFLLGLDVTSLIL